MHIDLMFPSKYLKTADLRGKEVTLTIRRVVREEAVMTGGKKDRVWVLYFEETRRAAEKAGNADDEKRYIFRTTVAKQIAKALGESDAEKWPGKRVTFFPTKASGKGGEIVDAIRVRETAPPPVSETEPAPAVSPATTATEAGAQ